MNWQDIIKKGWTPKGCEKRKKLTPQMKKDIDWAVRKITGELTAKERVEEILDINAILVDPPKKKGER